jgi:hypothetical protein
VAHEPQAAPSRTPPSGPPAAAAGTTTRPTVPSGIDEYILPNNLTVSQALQSRPAGTPYASEAAPQGLIYRPAILAQASIRFLNRKYSLDYELVKTVLVTTPDRRGSMRWEDHLTDPVDPEALDREPAPQARFAALDFPFSEAKVLAALQKDFLDWVYRGGQAAVQANEALKLYAGPPVTTAEFRRLCADAARQASETELRKLSSTYDRKIDSLKTKLEREERELSQDQTELSQRKWEEMGTHAENVFGLFGGKRSGRRISSSLSKRRMTEQAKADVEESQDAIGDLKKQIAALEEEKAQAIEEANARWGETAIQVTEITVTPLKKDVLLDLFGVAWVPHHVVKIGPEVVELPGYRVT